VLSCSLIIPTYNRCESLKRLLNSISLLEVPPSRNVELIVVDNNSVDGTRELLDDDTVRPQGISLMVLTEYRKGKANALNRGLSEAKGQFFLIIDDDVTVTPQRVLRHIEAYREMSVGAVQGRILPGLDPAGNSADLTRLREYNIPVFDRGLEYKEIRGLTGTNMSFTRAVFETVGFFDARLGPGASGFSEDTEYSLRIRNAGFKIGYAPHAVVYHALDPTRYGREYNRAAEYRKGMSRSIYRHDPILFRVLPDLLANCVRYGCYRLLGKNQKAFKAEGRILKRCGYLARKLRALPVFKSRGAIRFYA
jgi:GT2 family glycosyltransferase